MIDAQSFQIDDPDYRVSRLGSANAESLQKLFDRCGDYALIVDGERLSPSAAQERKTRIVESLLVGDYMADNDYDLQSHAPEPLYDYTRVQCPKTENWEDAA
jgi:hypothetical protein